MKRSAPVQRWQRLLLLLFYTGAFAVVSSALLVAPGFPLDDSYLYQTVARGLAHGQSGFYPGRPGAGATSFLWVCLQSLNFVFGCKVNPVMWNLVLNWVLLVAIGQLLLTLADRDRISEPVKWILAISPAICGNFLWIGLIGMEHLLLLCLSLAAICLWFRQAPEQTIASTLLVGVITGLLVVTRPEGAPLAPLLALYARRAHRSLRDVVLLLGCWAVFVAGFFAVNLYTSHSLMPVTMQGRLWLWFRFQGGPHSDRAVEAFFTEWLSQLPRMFSSVFGTAQITHERVDRLYLCLAFVLFALAVTGLVSWRRLLRLRLGVLLGLTGIQFCMYLSLFPVLGHGGRYQSFLLMLLFPLIFSGLWLLLPVAAWRYAAILAVMMLCGVFSLTGWRTITIDGIRHITETHGAMAIWIHRHLPADARVGAFDSGRISYALPQQVTDLGGLADSGYLPYLMDDDISEYLEKYGIHYVVQPAIEEDEMLDLKDSRIKLEELTEFCSPSAMWLRGFLYTGHAWQCQRLYKVTIVSSAEY